MENYNKFNILSQHDVSSDSDFEDENLSTSSPKCEVLVSQIDSSSMDEKCDCSTDISIDLCSYGGDVSDNHDESPVKQQVKLSGNDSGYLNDSTDDERISLSCFPLADIFHSDNEWVEECPTNNNEIYTDTEWEVCYDDDCNIKCSITSSVRNKAVQKARRAYLWTSLQNRRNSQVQAAKCSADFVDEDDEWEDYDVCDDDLFFKQLIQVRKQEIGAKLARIESLVYDDLYYDNLYACKICFSHGHSWKHCSSKNGSNQYKHKSARQFYKNKNHHFV